MGILNRDEYIILANKKRERLFAEQKLLSVTVTP